MQDLNDLFYFVEVVTHGGFAAAGRALGQPKSKLSRRIAQLEERLGVQLIERSTRRFHVTEIGQSFYERCRSVMTAAEAANAVVAENQDEAQGIVRFSCPTGMLEPISATFPEFLSRYPKVRLQIVATNRAVNLIDQRIDVALRVRRAPTRDTALMMRSLATSRRILVASPQMAARIEPRSDITALESLPTLSSNEETGVETWTFQAPDGTSRSIRHEPRLTCAEFPVLREAVIAGLGIALMPDHVCRREVLDGRLVPVFGDWREQEAVIHIVFSTNPSIAGEIRAFIDHLATRFRDDILLRDSAHSA